MSQITEIQAPPKTNARKKRGWKFWLGAVVLGLIALPLLAWLGAWAYLNFGFVNGSIEATVARRLGTSAHVGAVKSGVLSGMSIERVTVDALDKGAPITVDAVRVEWDAADAFTSGKLRSVSIDGPKVELRRAANSGWNFKLNPSDGDGGGRILRLNVSDGRFASDLWGAGKISFENIRGSGSQGEGQGPNPFFLNADFLGRTPWSLSGGLGPTAGAFDVRVVGALDLGRDLPVLDGFDPGAKGDVRFEVSARGEPLAVGGTINLKNVWIKLPGEGAVEIPSDDWDFQAVANSASKGGEIALDSWRLTSGRLGRLDGKAWYSPSALRIDDVSGTVDLAALEGMCAMGWPDAFFSVRGTAELSHVSIGVPSNAGLEGIGITGSVQARRIYLSVPEFGDLPPVDVSVHLDFPRVNRGTFKLGDVASVEVETDNALKIKSMDSFVDTVHVGKFNVDLGRFFESEIVRRVLARTPASSPVPSLRDLIWNATGSFAGSGLKTTWSAPYAVKGSSTLKVTGMNAFNLGVTKWPWKLQPPPQSFSGAMTQSIEFEDGKIAGVSLESELKSLAQVSGPADGSDIVSMKVSAHMARGDGGWHLEPVEFQDVKVPFAALENSLHVLAGSGITLTGGIDGGYALYDLTDGSAHGEARLSGGGELPLNESARGFLASVLRVMNQGLAASVMESMGVVERVKAIKFNAEIEFQISGEGVISIKGKTKPFDLAVPLPLVGDRRVAQVPEIEFRIDSQPISESGRPAGGWKHVVSLSMLNGRVEMSIEQMASGEFVFNGNFGEDASEIEGAVSGAFNLREQFYGPFHLTVPKVDLAVLGPLIGRGQTADQPEKLDAANSKAKAVKPRLAWGGAVEKIGVHAERFKWSGGAPELGLRATARFSHTTFSVRGMDFENVKGSFTGIANLGKENASVDALLAFDAFNARLNLDGEEFEIPSPAGQPASLKLALKIPRTISGGGVVRLENGDFDYGGMLNFTARKGALTLDAGGKWSSAELGDAVLRIADLNALQGVLEGPNEDLVGKLLGDVKLAGKASYSGLGKWEGENRFGLRGALKLENCVLPTGAQLAEKSATLSGEIPVQVRVKFEDGKLFGQRWKTEEDDEGRLVGWAELLQQMKERVK